MQIPIQFVHPATGVPGASSKGTSSDEVASDAVGNGRVMDKLNDKQGAAAIIQEGSATSDRHPDGRAPWGSKATTAERTSDRIDQHPPNHESSKNDGDSFDTSTRSEVSADSSISGAPSVDAIAHQPPVLKTGGSLDYQA